MWLPYIFVLPGSFLFTPLLGGFKKGWWKFVLLSVVMCAFLGLGTYSIVAMKLGISSLPQIEAWISAASHSIDHLGGVPRAVLGFVRSWFEMGDAGITFRRFLLKDPYAPVSFHELLFAGTWKILLTYFTLAGLTLKLLRGSILERRVLLFLTISFLPVFAFGVQWQGADMERYLAAFPALILAGVLACGSDSARSIKVLCSVFVISLVLTNVPHDSRWAVEAHSNKLNARLAGLETVPQNSYVVVFPGDPLAGEVLSKSAPGHRPQEVTWLITIGSKGAAEWRRAFAANSLAAWSDGGQVWISREFLSERPQKEFGWVEGAEPSVKWTDVYRFFQSLQISEIRGEFAKIQPTTQNLSFMNESIRSPR